MLKYDSAKQLQKLQPKKEHFSIRKFSVGAASVLIGFSFLSLANSQVVKADAGQPKTVETIGKSVSASHAVLDRQQTIKSDIKSNESLEDQRSVKQTNDDSGSNDHRADQDVIKEIVTKKAFLKKNLKNETEDESKSVLNKKDVLSKTDAVGLKSKVKSKSIPTSGMSTTIVSTDVNNYHKTNDGSANDPEIDTNVPTVNEITWIDYGYGNKPLRKLIYKQQNDGTYLLVFGDGSKDRSGDTAPKIITKDQFRVVWLKGYTGNSDTSNFPISKTSTSFYTDKNNDQKTYTDPLLGNSKDRVSITFGYEAEKVFGFCDTWSNVYSNYYGAEATDTVPTFEQNQNISKFNQQQYQQLVNVKDLEQGGWNGVNVDPNDPDMNKGKKFYMTWAPGKQPSTAAIENSVPGKVRIHFNDGTWLDIDVKINIKKAGTKEIIETKDVIRTINVHNPDGRINPTEQVVEFKRSNTINDVTQEVISYGKWERVLGSAKDWPEFTAPVIDGYTADPASVAEQSVDPNTKNETKDIYYHKNNNGGNHGQSTNPNPNPNPQPSTPTPQPSSPAPEPKPQTPPTKPDNGGKKSNPKSNNVKPKATTLQKHQTRESNSRTDIRPERNSKKGLTKINVLPEKSTAKVKKQGNKYFSTGQSKGDRQAQKLPQTDERHNNTALFIGLALAGLAGLFGLAGDRKRNKR